MSDFATAVRDSIALAEEGFDRADPDYYAKVAARLQPWSTVRHIDYVRRLCTMGPNLENKTLAYLPIIRALLNRLKSLETEHEAS